MKVFLMFLLLCLNASIFSQCRLGSHIDTLRAEFADPEYKLKFIKVHGDYPCLFIRIRDATVVYSFDSTSVCEQTFIMPDNNDVVNSFVKKYNENYVTISPTKWKAYGDKAIFDIQLSIGNDSVRSSFLWTWSENE